MNPASGQYGGVASRVLSLSSQCRRRAGGKALITCGTLEGPGLPQAPMVVGTAPPLIPKSTLFRKAVPALSGRYRLPAHTLLCRRSPESLYPFLIHLSEGLSGSQHFHFADEDPEAQRSDPASPYHHRQCHTAAPFFPSSSSTSLLP